MTSDHSAAWYEMNPVPRSSCSTSFEAAILPSASASSLAACLRVPSGVSTMATIVVSCAAVMPGESPCGSKKDHACRKSMAAPWVKE